MIAAPELRPVIRTPDQRLRVFISSTLVELAPERAAAREAVEQLRLAPVMFELGARPHPPRALYQAYIEQSEIFVGIYWQRYGLVAPEMEISGLEDEYILCGDKPRLVYVKTPAPEIEPRLAELLQRLEDDGLTSYRLFETPEELHDALVDDLALLLSEAFGWTGSPSTAAAEVATSRPLPVPLTRLIGREGEVADLCSLLSDGQARLVTITGAGGTGKSRLALEAARLVGDGFRGGAVFVDLAAITAADQFLPQLARALEVAQEGDRPLAETVVDRLTRRPPLLVLDNFEHVVEAAPVLASTLAACPDVSALVTSRVPLLVRGEREYRAAPLPTSAASSSRIVAEIAAAPATQLFVERAADAAPGFALTEENALSVAEICRRVDGLPLALELVAARVRVLAPAALLERLRGRLDLPPGPVDLPERQRTLRATIDWSYGLLEEPERELFERLAVFAGGFTLAAAEAVCDDSEQASVVDTLSSLIEQSLVTADATTTAEPRFRMLETIREYAVERLAVRSDREYLERRHAQYYVGLCEQAEFHLDGPEWRLWYARLDAEIGNIRTLVDWTLRTGEHELIIRTWWCTMLYWWVRDTSVEIRPVLDEIVPLPETASARSRGESAWLLAISRVLRGDRDGARALFREALAVARETGDSRATTLSLAMLGATVPATTGAEGAWALHQEALSIVRRLDWRWGIAYILHHLGDTAIRDRHAAAVLAYASECLEIAREIENEPLAAMALWQLGWAHLLEDDRTRAHEALAESATICLHLHSIENMSYCLDGFVGVTFAEGDARLAARLSGAADAARTLLRIVPFPPLASLIHEFRAPARDALGEAGFASEHAAGSELTAEDALALAVTHD